jgi:hypothetical protein
MSTYSDLWLDRPDPKGNRSVNYSWSLLSIAQSAFRFVGHHQWCPYILICNWLGPIPTEIGLLTSLRHCELFLNPLFGVLDVLMKWLFSTEKKTRHTPSAYSYASLFTGFPVHSHCHSITNWEGRNWSGNPWMWFRLVSERERQRARVLIGGWCCGAVDVMERGEWMRHEAWSERH